MSRKSSTPFLLLCAAKSARVDEKEEMNDDTRRRVQLRCSCERLSLSWDLSMRTFFPHMCFIYLLSPRSPLAKQANNIRVWYYLGSITVPSYGIDQSYINQGANLRILRESVGITSVRYLRSTDQLAKIYYQPHTNRKICTLSKLKNICLPSATHPLEEGPGSARCMLINCWRCKIVPMLKVLACWCTYTAILGGTYTDRNIIRTSYKRLEVHLLPVDVAGRSADVVQ